MALSISRPPRAQRVAAFVLLAALLGAGGRVAYRTGWRSCLGATEAATPLAITNGPSEDSIVLAFGHNSTGVVGTYVSALSIHQSGYVTFGDGLRYPRTVGHTQLAPQELATLLRTVDEAKFVEFQHCYGRHAPFNPQDSWMMYNWGGKTRGVVWMSDPAEPRPPEGWSRITALLEPIRARIEQQKQEPSAPPHPRPR